MRRHFPIAQLLLLAFLPCTRAAESPVAFIDVNVIPMNQEQVLQRQTVIIKKGRIIEIGHVDNVKVPRKALKIDGRDRYLMPGLTGLHVHIKGGARGNPALLTLYAANGVTTVLNMEGFPYHLRLRDDVASGKMFGPRIFTVGLILGGRLNPKTYERAVDAVQRQVEMGFDFIKVYSFLSPEGFRGVMDEAQRSGVPVVGHAVRSVPFETSLKRGQHLAHMEEILYGYFKDILEEDRIPHVVEMIKDSEIAVIATLAIYHNIIKQVEDIDAMLKSEGIEYVPASLTRQWQPDRNQYTTRIESKQCSNRPLHFSKTCSGHCPKPKFPFYSAQIHPSPSSCPAIASTWSCRNSSTPD